MDKNELRKLIEEDLISGEDLLDGGLDSISLKKNKKELEIELEETVGKNNPEENFNMEKENFDEADFKEISLDGDDFGFESKKEITLEDDFKIDSFDIDDSFSKESNSQQEENFSAEINSDFASLEFDEPQLPIEESSLKMDEHSIDTKSLFEEDIQTEEIFEEKVFDKKEVITAISKEETIEDIEFQSKVAPQMNFFPNENNNAKVFSESTLNELKILPEENNLNFQQIPPNEDKEESFIDIKEVDFPELDEKISGANFDVGLFSNIPVKIDVILGSASISLKQIYDLSEGSIIELDKLYGEPLELRVNGESIGTGEVVAIDNTYGIMVNELRKK